MSRSENPGSFPGSTDNALGRAFSSEDAAESEVAVTFIDVADVEFRVDPLSAEGNLMLARVQFTSSVMEMVLVLKCAAEHVLQ